MTAPRYIPSNDVISYTILSEGNEIPHAFELVSIQTNSEVNRINTAVLIFKDGSPADEEFELSNQEEFVLGNQIEIKLGYAQNNECVFKGVIVKHKIGARGQQSYLEVFCKDKSYVLTNTQKCTVFLEKTDGDIIEDIVSEAGLESEVETTSFVHSQMVQYNSTNWDFIINRAESNGQIVIGTKGKLKTQKPEVKETADLELVFGATIIDFETELDATFQEEELVSRSWDYSTGEALENVMNVEDLSKVGNLSSNSIATATGFDKAESFLSALNKSEELEKVAEAEQQRRRLSKMRGSLSCQGTSTVEAGCTISLNGLGNRFNGNVFVSGVSHVMRGGDWITHLQLGLSEKNHLEKFKPMPKSAFNIPRTHGLEIGKVVDLDDPDGEFRVQVEMPVFNNEGKVWARVAQPDAGNERSLFIRPEIGDEVVLGFLNNDPRYPIILGGVHSSNSPSPIEQNSENNEKGFVTRSNLKLIFNDDEKSILVETPGGNSVVLSDQDESIKMTDQHGNKIVMDQSGISIQSAGEVSISSSGETEIKAGSDVNIEGINVNASAQAQFKAEGSAGAELSTSGSAVVKGSIVQIN